MDPVVITDKTEDVRRRLDYLTVVTEALWSFFLDQGYTERQLADRIKSVDMLDGRLDHRYVHRAACSYCGASVTTEVCQFCGLGLEGPFAPI